MFLRQGYVIIIVALSILFGSFFVVASDASNECISRKAEYDQQKEICVCNPPAIMQKQKCKCPVGMEFGKNLNCVLAQKAKRTQIDICTRNHGEYDIKKQVCLCPSLSKPGASGECKCPLGMDFNSKNKCVQSGRRDSFFENECRGKHGRLIRGRCICIAPAIMTMAGCVCPKTMMWDQTGIAQCVKKNGILPK